MSILSPEAALVSISKDVERLTSIVTESALLFRDNQQALNLLIGELREHKAVDDIFHDGFKVLQNEVFGAGTQVGLVTKVYDNSGKIGSIWKVLWSAIGAVVTACVAYVVSRLG